MDLGIFCVSLPALSKMLHHHLPPLETLRSQFRSRLVKLRSSNVSGSMSHSKITEINCQDQLPMGNSNTEPCAHSQTQPYIGRSLAFQPTYELGDLRSVHTFINSRTDGKFHIIRYISPSLSSSKHQARLDSSRWAIQDFIVSVLVAAPG